MHVHVQMIYVYLPLNNKTNSPLVVTQLQDNKNSVLCFIISIITYIIIYMLRYMIKFIRITMRSVLYTPTVSLLLNDYSDVIYKDPMASKWKFVILIEQV